MQTVVTTRITIDTTPAEVFRYITDLKHHYLWNPQVREISTTERLKLGTTFETESQVLGVTVKCANTVKSFVRPSELTIENKLGIVVYTAKFRFMPQHGKTAVQLDITLSTDAKSFVFTKPILKQLAVRELHSVLQALKIAVENNLQ